MEKEEFATVTYIHGGMAVEITGRVVKDTKLGLDAIVINESSPRRKYEVDT